ncbi:MAG: lipase [Actinomycetota bacterium]|nr:lipase [Actinomycetota bacterium]
MGLALRALLVGAVLVGLGTAGTATATAYAPLNRPGPRLTVPTPDLKAALHCEGDFRHGSLQPVLLSPGTSATPKQNFSWNYERAFNAQHRPWCDLTMPHHTLGDIQVAGEYLVYGIRTMHRMAGRKIAVLGHSQGGMSMRWALRFWPDTRPMVDDIIGMAPTNHGTNAGGMCQAGRTSCPPANWQQADTAKFIAALNSRAETFRGISYTNVLTHTDEEVKPSDNAATASSSLRTGAGAITNVAVQDLCPNDPYEHNFNGTVDPVTYGLVMDALNHPGPARPSRVPRAVCDQQYQPGIDPANPENYLQPVQLLPAIAGIVVPTFNLVGAPETPDEPPLRCYVFERPCR